MAHGTPFLHLELGDFFKQDDVTGDYESGFIWDMLEKMHVSAASPGPRELGAWKSYVNLIARGTIPVVESNVTLKEGGAEKPIGVPYKVLNCNGVRVALFSLMGGSEFAAARIPEGVEFAFKDPFQVAESMVPMLHKQADLVVLMSQMSPTDTDRLIQTVPGIDVALYGQKAGYEQNAKKVGETLVNQTGTRGQYAGELVLIVDPAGKVVDFGSHNVALDTAVPEDSTVAKAVAEASAKANEMRTHARQEKQSEFENKLSGERFLGADNCRRCHEKQYEQWAASPHAHAFAALDKPVDGKPRTPACVSCHVTGFGQPTGYVADASAGKDPPSTMANVQCEACHFKGTEHTRTGTVALDEATCRTCHTAEWSPKFDFKTALAAVKH